MEKVFVNDMQKYDNMVRPLCLPIAFDEHASKGESGEEQMLLRLPLRRCFHVGVHGNPHAV